MDRGAWRTTYSPWGHKRVGHESVTKQQHNNSNNLSIYIFNDIFIICLVKPVVRGRIETQFLTRHLTMFAFHEFTTYYLAAQGGFSYLSMFFLISSETCFPVTSTSSPSFGRWGPHTKSAFSAAFHIVFEEICSRSTESSFLQSKHPGAVDSSL